jgi:hypothetical protein
MPTEALDAWEEVAWQEVERQACINTSLGPKEFQGPWLSKKDQHRERQGQWKKGILYQKSDKEPDAMDVNVMQVQNGLDQETKEKQQSKGHCFLCNKQGHLKRNCPTGGRGNSLLRISSIWLIVEEVQTEQGESNDFDDKVTPQGRNELMIKLHRMRLQERDKVIHALISQKDF